MPWFDPQPTAADSTFWRFNVDGHHRVSRWPRYDTPRIDSRYRLNGTRNLTPSPLRWLATWRGIILGQPDDIETGWFDVSPVTDDHLSGNTGESPLGITFTLELKGFFELPNVGERGVELTMRLDSDLGEWYEEIWEYEMGTITDYRVPIWTDFHPPTFTTAARSAGWPYTETQPSVQGISECYDFPTPQPAPGAFAQGNGVDAYIQLDSATPFFGWYHKAEFDVRFRSLSNVMFYGATGGGANAMYLDSGLLHFSGTTIPIAPLPPLDQWVHFEIERGWHVPANPNYNVRIDGNLVGSVSGPNFAITIDRILGNVGPFAPPMWADIDMKNLTIDNGNVTAPNLILDMPMDPNACDVGPLLKKGTTFNMPLPSCP